MTPQKTWNERKPNVSYLKVFGSIDYVLVDDQVKTKLADKSKKMIFVSNDKKKIQRIQALQHQWRKDDD